MDIFIQWAKHAIKSYGYLGVFGSQMLGMFGLPVPDETILTFTGFLVHKTTCIRCRRCWPPIWAVLAGSL